MNKKIAATALVGLSALVAGCDSASGPTLSAADIAAAQAQYNAVVASPATTVLPASGTASMTGFIGGDTTGDIDGFIGELALGVDFGTNVITGSVSNVNILDSNGNPEQTAGGSLSVAGNTAGTGMNATASGSLTGVDQGVTGSSNVNLNLAGQFHDFNGTADAVEGTVTGGGSGDFGFTVGSSAIFYAD